MLHVYNILNMYMYNIIYYNNMCYSFQGWIKHVQGPWRICGHLMPAPRKSHIV